MLLTTNQPKYITNKIIYKDFLNFRAKTLGHNLFNLIFTR